MPVDAALIAARLGKPGDLRHPVTDRDQKHPTVSAATQANTRDLAKWHVDHAPHSQPVRLTVFHHGRGSHAQPLPDDFSITSSAMASREGGPERPRRIPMRTDMSPQLIKHDASRVQAVRRRPAIPSPHSLLMLPARRRRRVEFYLNFI